MRAGLRVPRAARNTAYRPALALLLARLRDLDAVIQDALVDLALGSAPKHRRGSSPRLIISPIRLSEEPDIEALRLRLTSAQARIAQAPAASKGGNSSKRIRLRLDVPGFPPDAADQLEAVLAEPARRQRGDLSVTRGTPGGQTFPEGTLERVEVNRYERDRRARRLCLAHWGSRCVVCELDFCERYGQLGQDFIHVHHVLELSSFEDRAIAWIRVNDLRPVLPELPCHDSSSPPGALG